MDAAPTGETLRLLSLPEAARWWMEKVEPIGRRVSRLTGPLVQRVVGIPMPDDAVFDAGEALFGRLEHMHDLLADAEKTSIRVVLTLESVVVKEAQRAFTYFHLYDYPTDLVIANRILPDAVGALLPGLVRRPARERAHRGADVRTRSRSSPPRISSARSWASIASASWRRRSITATDPTEHFYRGRPYSVFREDGAFVLSLELPFTTKEQISLSRHADELVVDVGTWRRNLVLPRALISAEALGAQFEDHVLKIRFKAPARPAADSSSRR